MAGSVRLVLGPPGTAAPLAPFELGVEVGVPTGTSLTASSGLGTNDGTDSLTITHPISGAQNTFTVTKFYRRRWTATINPNPGAGVHYLFDECEFDCNGENFCVDMNNTNAVNNQMAPQIIFRRCTFDGNSTTTKAIVESYAWVLACHLANTEDGWSGLMYSVLQDSNILCTTDGGVDPHADGVQQAAEGHFTAYHNYLHAGTDPSAANAAIRIGTEGSAVTNVEIYYNYMDTAGSSTLQVRGDAGAGDITDVDVQHNRWGRSLSSDPADFAETTGITWVDNKYSDGEVINP